MKRALAVLFVLALVPALGVAEDYETTYLKVKAGHSRQVCHPAMSVTRPQTTTWQT
jgi:hypothetical protein